MNKANTSYWGIVWHQFKQHRLGMVSLWIFLLFCIAAIYAPLLASSKPLFVIYDGEAYFPLFRYLFYTRFYTKWLDIFFNLLMFTFLLGLLGWKLLPSKLFQKFLVLLSVLQIVLFIYLIARKPSDPAGNQKYAAIQQQSFLEGNTELSWQKELSILNGYAKLNLVLRTLQHQQQDESLQQRFLRHQKTMPSNSSLWQMEESREKDDLNKQTAILRESPGTDRAKTAQEKVDFLIERRAWINAQIPKLHYLVMPLIRPYHWEDDVGGQQSLNQEVPWWELTRINKKDLIAALIFGIRISLVVGVLSVGLALAIGVPIGAFAGYYGGTFDIIVSRLLEVWESMPTFFMLLMVVAITQSKSIFIIITVIGIFGWTSFSRYIRGETFKQRNLPYVEACKAIGFPDRHIIFSQILPNAIPPLLTLLPFAMMGAITSEAGLSFLGLGEEGSTSWGVLMDEGRSAFPGESYLLWPPAILLTILLVCIALIGDALRDALDPKMHT